MRLYFEAARCAFRRQMAYQLANWAGLATNLFWGYFRAYVFVAFFAVRPEVAGYDARDALGYVWITQALLMFSTIFGSSDIAETIRTGQVASDLSKPFDYYAFWLGRDVGRAAYYLAFRAVPIYLFGVVLFGIGVPASAATWAGLAASLICAELVSFAFRFLVNVSAFWLLDVRGLSVIASILMNFFSGGLVPNNFFPDWLRAISDVLPFQAMLYLPCSVLLEKLTGPALAWALGQQVLWFLVLMVAGRSALALGTRRLIIQGG